MKDTLGVAGIESEQWIYGGIFNRRKRNKNNQRMS
jgi:hypothetical protein